MNRTRFKVLYTRKRNARSKFTDFTSIWNYLFDQKRTRLYSLARFLPYT
jgi:hypothetical protein